MGIKREHLDAFDAVPQDQIDSVVGEPGLPGDIGDFARGRGTDFVGGFPFFVLLDGKDVDPLMHLGAVRAHAAELASRPGASWSGGVEKRFLSCLEQGPVIGGKSESRGSLGLLQVEQGCEEGKAGSEAGAHHPNPSERRAGRNGGSGPGHESSHCLRFFSTM